MAFWITLQVCYLLLGSFCCREGCSKLTVSFSQRHLQSHIYFFLTRKTLQDIISEFTKMTGVTLSKTWSPMVTHVIASANKNGACKRTLKFLMAILHGKWILSIDCKSNLLSLFTIISALMLNFLSLLYHDFLHLSYNAGIKACMEAREPVDEETYEITVDVHGISRGPQLGRLRLIHKVSFSPFVFFTLLLNIQKISSVLSLLTKMHLF